MLDRTGPRVDSRLPEWHSMETGLNWTPACLVLVGQRPIRDLSVNLVLSLFLFFFRGAVPFLDPLQRPRSFVHGYKTMIYTRRYSKDDVNNAKT